MALLTIPSITKGTPASISLDKEALFGIASVAADAYFGDSENVKMCFVYYKSTAGNQKKVLNFNLEDLAPADTIVFSAKARPSFAVTKIVLEDYDEGFFTIPVEEIPSGLNIVIS